MTTMTLRERAAQEARRIEQQRAERRAEEERKLRRRMAERAAILLQSYCGLEAVPDHETGTAIVDGVGFAVDGNVLYLATQADWPHYDRVYICDWETLHKALNAPAPEPEPNPIIVSSHTPPVEESLDRIADALDEIARTLVRTLSTLEGDGLADVVSRR